MEALVGYHILGVDQLRVEDNQLAVACRTIGEAPLVRTTWFGTIGPPGSEPSSVCLDFLVSQGELVTSDQDIDLATEDKTLTRTLKVAGRERRFAEKRQTTLPGPLQRESLYRKTGQAARVYRAARTGRDVGHAESGADG